jgi:CHASE2 domain-containing sensor protein
LATQTRPAFADRHRRGAIAFLHLTPWAQAVLTAVTTFSYSDEPTYRKTTVLLFTDDDVKSSGNRFPIPYSVHEAILRKLAQAKTRPRALFIDFAFVQPNRVTSAAFGKLDDAICESFKPEQAKAEEPPAIPVFVVDTRYVDDANPDGGSVFRCAKSVGAFVDTEEPGGGLMTYPVCGLRDTRDEDHRRWWIRFGAWVERQLGREHRPCRKDDKPGPYSAAYALWAVKQAGASAEATTATFEDRMALAWPAKTMPQRHCEVRHRGHALFETLYDVYAEGADSLKRRCPYTQTVTVGDLMKDEVLDEEIATKLRGSTVLYGAKIAFSDVINSPTHKDLPGVYYHAMAYDNLLTFGGKPIRETPHLLKHLIALGLSLVAVWLAFRSAHESERSATDSLNLYARMLIVIPLIALLAIGVLVGGTFFADGIPEYLVLGSFALYLYIRYITDREMARMSFGCFAIALLGYAVGSLSVDIFFAMILFLEVVHLLLHHLTEAAKNIADEHPRTLRQRVVFAILDPFMPD